MINPPKIGVPFGMVGPFVPAVTDVWTANQVQTCLFVVEGYSVTINRILWYQNTNVALSFCGFSIYAVTPGSATRGARLADTGPIDTSVGGGGAVNTPFLAPVTLAPGVYCLAFNESAGVQVLGTVPGGATVNAFAMYNACPEVFTGTAANVAVAGQNPAALGVITAVNAQKFPVVLLSN